MDFNSLKEKITKKHIVIAISVVVLIIVCLIIWGVLSGDSDNASTENNSATEVTETTTTTTAVTTTTAPQTTTTVSTTTAVTTTKPATATKKKEESSYVEEENYDYEEEYYEEPAQEPINENQYAEPEPEYVPEPEPEPQPVEPAGNYYYGQLFETGFQPAGCSYFCGVWVLNSQTGDWDFVSIFSDDDAVAWVISTQYGKPSVNYDDGTNSISGYVWLN